MKTLMILFTRKYKPETLRPITFYGHQLELSKQVKYLGVVLDSKLNWKEHVDAKYKRALAAFYQLRRVAGDISFDCFRQQLKTLFCKY